MPTIVAHATAGLTHPYFVQSRKNAGQYQSYNTVVAAFEPTLLSAWSDYAIAATEITPGVYTAVVASLPVAGSALFELRSHSGTPSGADSREWGAYEFLYDVTDDEFYTYRTEAAMRTLLYNLAVNVQQVNGKTILDPGDIGLQRTDRQGHGFPAVGPASATVTSNAVESITTATPTIYEVYRSSVVLDMTRPWSVELQYLVSTGRFGIGLLEPIADIDDASADVIDWEASISTTNMKFRNGLIVGDASKSVFQINANTVALDTSVPLNPSSSKLRLVCDPAESSFALYALDDNGAPTLIRQTDSAEFATLAGLGNLALGCVFYGGTCSLQLANMVISGEGWAGASTLAAGNLDNLDARVSDVAAQATLAATDAGTAATEAAAANAQATTLTARLTDSRATNLDNLDAQVSGIEGGTTQPRQNKPAMRAYRVQVSSTFDGTYKATRPIRLRPKTIDVAISVDMTPLTGNVDVVTVGAPTVSGGSITATALGPYNTERVHEAMVQLGGTATASESVEIEFTVTMDNGDPVPVTVDVEVFSG